MWRNFLLLGAVTLMLAANGFGQPRERMRHQMAERGAMMADRLNLNDSQKAGMQKLRLDHEKKQARLQSDIRIARIELKELLSAETPDRAAIEKKTMGINDLQGQAKLNRIDHMFAVGNILDKEQKAIWREHLSLRGGFMSCPHCGEGEGRRHMRGKW